MEHITPQKVQMAVKGGFERMAKYRKAQAMYIRSFVGQYYGEKYGLTGEEPINLYYNVLRATVPNLVMDNPLNQVVTRYVEHKDYAELLSLALDSLERDLEFKEVLRAGIVSAFFGMAVFKTSLRSAGLHIQIDDQRIDPGQVYVSLIDLDDFVMDPHCKSLRTAAFLGHRTTVPRQALLDSDVYNKDVVNKLPVAGKPGKGKDVADITRENDHEFVQMQDMVNVVEVWIPAAEAIITIPDPREFISEDYVGIQEYYGPPTGPYEFMSYSPPVPGNPLPIAPASVIYDLQDMANRIFKKTMNQADRQRDVLAYNPAFSDEAKDIDDANDGDAIAVTDPKNVQVLSFGGQNRGNVEYLNQMQVWFNYMAGNPDQMAGVQSNAKSATQATILQSNATITVEDARGITYSTSEHISAKLGWYLHVDPLIELPLIRRKPGGEEEQVILTPEQRSGDFMDFTFRVVQRSMNKLDPTIRSQRIMEFATNVMPAAVMTATAMMQLGRPFNLEAYLTRVADELGIGEWVYDLFFDPQFMERLQMFQMLGPANPGKGISSDAILQNHGFANKANIQGGGQIFNQNAQRGAAEMQSAIRPMAGGYM